MAEIVTLPSWISLDGQMGDVSALLPTIRTWADMGHQWRAIAAALWALKVDAPVDSPLRLVAYLAGHIDDEAVTTVFGDLGLRDLHDRLVKDARTYLDPASPWAKLLKPFSDFTIGLPAASSDDSFGFDAAGDDGELDLSIPAVAAEAAPALGPVALTFNVGAQGALQCEAGAPWPFRNDGMSGALLRIGGQGKVTTQAGVSLPLGQIGAGTVSGDASCEAALSFFFRPSDQALPFGEVLAGALLALPEPLSLSAISHAMALAGLEGLALGCDGAVSAGLGLIIGKSVDLPQVASIKAGVTANLSFKRNARWILSLRKVPEGMRFVLSRDDLRERDWAAGIDVALDASPLARRVQGLLTEAQDFAGPILSQIKPFLSPGTYLGNEAASLLTATASSIVEQPALRDALLKDGMIALGQGGTAVAATPEALAEALAGKIADLAAADASQVLGDADEWTGSVVKGLGILVPALAASGLDAELAARIHPLLSDVISRFDNLLDSLTGSADLSAGLGKELAATGGLVKAGDADADALLAGVRDAVQRFQDFAAKVTQALADSAKTKLQARFGWSGAESSSLKYELAGVFALANDDTNALWHALVTGRLEPFQQILANPGLTPSGAQLLPESSLSRFVSKEGGFGADVAVLGLDVSIASIVKGEATITTDLGGDITVSAQGSALRKVEGFGEGRSASFINSWDLVMLKADAAVGNRRAMAVNVAFDHDDKNLKADEVEKFLSGLSTAGLIEQSRVDHALGIYQGWRVKGAPDAKIQGSIKVQLRLPDLAVQRMIAIGQDLNRHDNASLTAIFDFAVRSQVDAGVTSAKQFASDIETAQDSFTISVATKDPAAYMVALWNSKISLLPSNGDGPELPALAQVIPRAGALVTLLSTMARIYDATPAGGAQASGMNEAQYAAAEQQLAAASRDWLRLNQNFIFWFKASLHPALVAFLRILMAMNLQAAIGSPASSGLASPIDTRTSNALFLIAMAGGDGDAQVAI